MRKKVAPFVLCVLLMASFVAPTFATDDLEADEEADDLEADEEADDLEATGNIEIGPGEHYLIHYDMETGELKITELPEARLPAIAHKAIVKAPLWIREKLKKAFIDLTRKDIRVPSNSKPVLGDLNGDQLLDLVIGSAEGALAYYENKGITGFPQWTRNDKPFSGISVYNYSTPSLVDLNGDEKLDLAVGCGDGKIYFWWNVGTKKEPEWEMDETVFAGIDIGNYSRPTFADLDADGLMDLIVGAEIGIFSYRNVGSLEKPAWIKNETLVEGVTAPSHSAPAFADLAGDGLLYFFIGAKDGKIYVYRNVGTIKKPSWEIDETLMAEVKLAGYSSPCFGDIDNDGRIDLLMGDIYGYIYRMTNFGTPFAPNYPVWKSGAEETLISKILWGPGYYPDIDRLVAVNEPNTMRYVEIYANLLLKADDSYKDEIAYCIANEQIAHLKIFADKRAEDIYVLNVKEIYEMAPKLKYLKLVEYNKPPHRYTTLAFHRGDGDWVEVPKEVYYQRLVMPNRYMIAPWGWPDRYKGNWYMTYLPWDDTYGVRLYDRVKDAETVTEAMWNVALWIKVDIGAYYHWGKVFRPRGWYNTYKNLINPNATIFCGEFSVITMVAGRAVLIPVANTINLGEDHQWDEFFNEELRWVHIDTSAANPGDVKGLRRYFDNPLLYDTVWYGGERDVSAVMWWEQGGRYDHVISRTEVTGYTPTSLIKFKVVDKNGRPIDGARVEAWGHWIERLYGIPLISYLQYTNLNGEAFMHLGHNNYTFIAITRIGHAVINKTIEEGRTYEIIFQIDKELPKLGEATLETREIKEPSYKINLEFKVLNGYQANPHWIHILWKIFGWQDYWYFDQGINLDAFILDEKDYQNFASGLNFTAYAMKTWASSGELENVSLDTNAYIILSNERSLTTTLKIEYKVSIERTNLLKIRKPFNPFFIAL